MYFFRKIYFHITSGFNEFFENITTTVYAFKLNYIGLKIIYH